MKRKNKGCMIRRKAYLIILACMLVSRAIAYSFMPPYTSYAMDTATYIWFDKNILLWQIDAFRTPVYPYFLKLVSWVFADGAFAVTVVQEIVSIVSVFFLYEAMMLMAKNKLQRVSALVLACYYSIVPQIFANNKAIMTESLSISSVAIFLYLLVSFIKRPKWAKAAGLMVFALFMVMLRPVFIAVFGITLGFFAIWAFFRKNRAAISGVIVGVLCLSIILSYMDANFRQNKVFAISSVSTNVNQCFLLIQWELYENPKYPDVSVDIKGLLMKYEHLRGGEEDWEIQAYDYYVNNRVLMDLTKIYSADVLAEYTKDTMKLHFLGYTGKVIMKHILPLMVQPMGTFPSRGVPSFDGTPPKKLSELASVMSTYKAEDITIFVNAVKGQNDGERDEKIALAVFPFQFMFVIALVVWQAWYILKKKKWEPETWVRLGLVVFIAVHFFAIAWGAQSSWQRLFVPIQPAVFLLLFLAVDAAKIYPVSAIVENDQSWVIDKSN